MKLNLNWAALVICAVLGLAMSAHASVSSSPEIDDSAPIVLEPGLYTTPELCGEYVSQGEHIIIFQHAAGCDPQGTGEFPETEPGIFIYTNPRTNRRVLLQPLNPTSFIAKLQSTSGDGVWKTLRQFLYLKS